MSLRVFNHIRHGISMISLSDSFTVLVLCNSATALSSDNIKLPALSTTTRLTQQYIRVVVLIFKPTVKVSKSDLAIFLDQPVAKVKLCFSNNLSSSDLVVPL